AGAAAARAHSTAPLRRLGARRRSLTSHGPPDRLVALSPELSGPLPGRAEQRGRAMGSHEQMQSRRPVPAAPWMLLARPAAGGAAEGGRSARAPPAAATSLPGAWLDAKATKNWNSRTAELPKAAARETDSLLPGGPCAEEILEPTGREDKAVADAGWSVVSEPQGRSGTVVVTAATGADGMCRPLGVQAFVFVEGRFA